MSRCETIGKYALPLFRSLVAKELTKTYNLTQMEIAKKLGTTQAAISQYLSSKRAARAAEHFGDVLPKIQVMARQTASKLVKKEISPEEIPADFCRLCSIICDKVASKSESPSPEYFL